MNKRRYRIEGTKATLKRFIEVLMKHSLIDSFIHRVTPDVNEEYYYVVVSATESIHMHLNRNRFTDSIPVKS